MCSGASLGLVFGALSAASSVYSMLSKPSAPQPPAPKPPPQPAQTPDVTQSRAAAVRGIGGGPDPTLLTGAGGVSNDSLLLGRNTLLGS
jgi:hypothetical protein